MLDLPTKRAILDIIDKANFGLVAPPADMAAALSTIRTMAQNILAREPDNSAPF